MCITLQSVPFWSSFSIERKELLLYLDVIHNQFWAQFGKCLEKFISDCIVFRM